MSKSNTGLLVVIVILLFGMTLALESIKSNTAAEALPSRESFIGSCRYDSEDDAYTISIDAFVEGRQQSIVSGRYGGRATAKAITKEVIDYYDLIQLSFGDASEECSHIQGWVSRLSLIHI